MFQRVLLDFVLKTFGLGAENETRTRDPNLGKVVLYQLSYFRVFADSFVLLTLPRLEFDTLGGKVVLYQLSYFRITFRTQSSYFPIASAKVAPFLISPKYLAKKIKKNAKYAQK